MRRMWFDCELARRVKQDHTFMKGKQVELGAEFLHGDTTPLMDLVAKHGLKVWWLCTWAQVRSQHRRDMSVCAL